MDRQKRMTQILRTGPNHGRWLSGMSDTGQHGIVLALGGGGARGLAHLGVIEVLVRENIPVQAIVGTSIGAEIGAFFAAGTSVEEMKQLACRMDWISTMRLFTPDFAEAGLTGGKGIHEYLSPYMADKVIENLPIAFAAVATDLANGEEVVIHSGNLLDAVRASISYPGLLSPFRRGGQVLIDGSMVNPVPFDVARKCFGGPVLAIQAHPQVAQNTAYREPDAPEWEARLQELLGSSWLTKTPQVKIWLQGFKRPRPASAHGENSLGVSTVMSQARLISEDMLMRLRMRLSPPDILLQPDISRIGALEFYKAEEAILAGCQAAESALPSIRALCSEPGT